MNYGKAALGIVMLGLMSFASIKITFFDTHIPMEHELTEVHGTLASIDCRKGRYVEAIRLYGDQNKYWLEQKPNLLPRCEEAKNEWIIGTEINLQKTPASFRKDIYAYQLSVGDAEIFKYQDAVLSVNSSKQLVVGFTVFCWALVLICVAIRKFGHNK